MNGPWVGAPNPNAAGVAPLCPCPVAPKLNGDAVPAPVDCEGVTGVNVNVGGLESVVPLVVPWVLETSKEDAGLFVAGVGVSCIVGNALTGVDVIPNTPPFGNGLGPGLGTSWFGAVNRDTPGEVPAAAGMLRFVDGKVAFESDPPAGLLAAKLKRGWEDCGAGWEGVGWAPNTDWAGWLVSPKGEGPGWLVAPNGEGVGCDWVAPNDGGIGCDCPVVPNGEAVNWN